jgi:hypothetical protein
MRLNVLSAVLLALSLPAVALVYEGTCIGSLGNDVSRMTSETSDEPASCQHETKTAAPKQTGNTGAGPTEPDRQIVFKVEGLTCPLVMGLGCGHSLQGVLASLDKIDGVAATSANYTGTMIRISVASQIDRGTVVEGVRKLLTTKDRKAVLLAGVELKCALDREEWREAARIGELSAIEFHTLVFHWIKTFAKVEKLDKKTADKLVAIAEHQWERICKQAKEDGKTEPEDWLRRLKAALPVVAVQAKKLFTPEQFERFQQALKGQCCDGNCPAAPPDAAASKNTAMRNG